MELKLHGRSLVVDDYGQGDPVLLVHGLGGTANSWSPLVAGLASTHRVLVPDLPGAGRSAPDAHLSLMSLVNDLLGLIQKLALPAVHLIGHSMGTVVCQHLAVMAPEKVRDLVLLGPIAEPPEAARDALRQRAVAALKDGMDPIAEVICERGLAPSTRASQPLVTGFVRELLQRQSPASYAAQCRALADCVKADPTLVTARTLLIAGHEDGTSPPASVAALAAALPHAEHLQLENCGHWTLLEQPAAVVAAIQRFLAA